jgi:hypothetical protein
MCHYLQFFFLQVRKKLEKTAQYFKSLGSLGFWSHFVCTTVSAGILLFSAVAIGKATASFTFFATAIGMVAAFISVFRSYGYIRLSEMLKRTANEPSKVPPSHRLIGYTTALSVFHPQKCYGSSCPRNDHTPIKSYLTNFIKYAGSEIGWNGILSYFTFIWQSSKLH